MTKTPKPHKIVVSLDDEEARAFAQFIKRATYQDFLACAQDHDEADRMTDAATKLRYALAEAGFAPR